MKRIPGLIWGGLMAASLLSLSSCKKKVPSDVIQPAQMEDLLYDYHLAQAAGNQFSGQDYYKKELLMQYVFQKHHVTEAQFDSSMVWYTRNMEKLGDIYTDLDKRFADVNLNAGRNYLMQQETAGAASGDTVDVWNDRRFYALTPADLNNRVTFKVKADTTFHELDRFIWKMDVYRPQPQRGELYAGLNIYYQNDSVAGITRRVDKGELNMMVKADTFRISYVQGFMLYRDTVTGEKAAPVVVRDVKLMRIHPSKQELDWIKRVREQRLKADSLKNAVAKPEIKAPQEVADTLSSLPNRRVPGELRRPQTRIPKK